MQVYIYKQFDFLFIVGYFKEILSESCAVMKKVQVSKDKEAFFFKRCECEFIVGGA